MFLVISFPTTTLYLNVNIGIKYLAQNDFPEPEINTDPYVFANEDISKPENRINLSLFGLFLINDFRTWILEKLGLPTDAVIFPSVNLKGGIRPDFAVHNLDDKPIAYIEVEIDKDFGQLQNFRNLLDVPVFSIWGKKEYNGDLNLVEIYHKDDFEIHSMPS